MTPSSVTPVIRTQGLCQRVADGDGGLTLLADIDLRIDAGEAVAVTGPSGSGKTTLLGLLAGLDTPTDGEVWLYDTALAPADEDRRARLRAAHVGFVFQSFHLLPELTALENVLLALELRGGTPAQAEAALNRVGLGARLHHTPRELSGGEQQRVALARALVNRPSLLFADEPTGNLDRHTAGQVTDLLFRLVREDGMTLVLVTHDEALARRCDRVLRLDGGRLQP